MNSSKMLISLSIVFLFIMSFPVYAANQTLPQREPSAAAQIEPMTEPIVKPVTEPQMTPAAKSSIEDKGLVNPDQPVFSQAPDYRNSIAEIQDYIYKNIPNTFASLHIDRDENGRENTVLSFTAEVSPSHKQAILTLADNPESIIFRLVDFSEQQLAEKQREIGEAWNTLSSEGIKIHHTGVNVFVNRVEVGIEPYNQESIAKVCETFGSEMVSVVEGHEVQLLAQADSAEPAVAPESGSEDQDSLSQESLALERTAASGNVGFFEQIAQFFKSIFNWLTK